MKKALNHDKKKYVLSHPKDSVQLVKNIPERRVALEHSPGQKIIPETATQEGRETRNFTQSQRQ